MRGQIHKPGFTLVELLVSIGIVAALAALAVSVSQRGLSRAKQAQCMNNMRQIGAALVSHAGDHNGFFPQTSHTTSVNRAWIAALEEELGEGYDDFRLCPADPKCGERRKRGGTSYILNSYIFVPQIGALGEQLSPALNNIRRIPRPSGTLMAFIISDRQTVEASSDHTHSRGWTGSWGRLLGDIQPDRHGTGGTAKDHSQGSANYLFVDGHVESWQAAEVKRRIESGDNIALPPGLPD